MTCQNTDNITIRFPRTGLELRPYSVDFRIDRTQLDFLEAKFSKEVGDYLEPMTDEAGDVFRQSQPAEIVMDGEVSNVMYFRPDYVTYGETNCWIELHDPQKHLQFTVIDKKFANVTAKESYTRIYEAAGDDIITGIDFKIPDTATSNVPDAIPKGPGGVPLKAPQVDSKYVDDKFRKFTNLWKDYDEESKPEKPSQNVLDSLYEFDLSNQTALQAIATLNGELGLSSWVNNKGVLVVGLDFMDATHHVASANDSRVWRYHNAELTPPGSPIKMAVVNGGMIDAPNDTQEEDGLESVFEFLNPTESHKNDLIAQGVAQRPGIIDGKIINIDQPNLSRDALEARAFQVLANEMTNNNSGSVEINPETSGLEISDWRNINVGDFLQLIPANGQGCKELERTIVLISGVKHKVDGGSWKITLQIQKWANPEPRTTLRYFSPDSDNYYNATDDYSVGEQIYTNE